MVKLRIQLSRRWVLLALLASAAGLSLLGPGVSRSLRGAAGCVLAPLGEGGMYTATIIEKHLKGSGARAISPAEAQRLLAANRELRGKLQAVEGELGELIATSASLRRLYGPIPYGQWELIASRVIAAGSLPYSKTRVIGSGTHDGARSGAPVTTRRLMTDRSKALPTALAVISATALVGELTAAGAFTAECRLVTDSQFQTRAKIIRMVDQANPRTIVVTAGDQAREVTLTDEYAMEHLVDVWVRGDGKGAMVGEVNAYERIRVGDWLVTMGDPTRLPARIRIGQIVEVGEDPERRGLFDKLRIEPHADLAALREVYIVLPIGSQSPKESEN